MKKFDFTLQSLLELRLCEEDAAKTALAARESEYQSRLQEFNTIKEELHDFQEREKIHRQNASVMPLRHSVSWRHELKLRLLKKGQEIQEVTIDIQRSRKELSRLMIARKSLETLREKKFEEWKKEQNRREQIFLDELSYNAYSRRR